jgi:glycosyltransferase involved in cell wall biosynthesis
MVPVYNEEPTLEITLGHVLARPEVGEVVAVDDGSTDGSWSILQAVGRSDPRVTLVRHTSNLGKGAALRNAISVISRPFALVQDADLEYDPRDYPELLGPLIEGRTDVVYGVRGFASHSSYSFWFVIGNRGVSMATNLLFDCFISDMETGYKAMRSSLWKRLNLQGNRFDIEPEITARLLRLGYRIHEVPIRYYARSREEGKKLTWKDGVKALSTLARLRLARESAIFRDSFDLDHHRSRQQELARRHPLLDTPPKGRPPTDIARTGTVRRGNANKGVDS